MFIQNIYARIYESFISKAKTRVKPNCYTEIHHILPKSLGGTDDISNLVVLTAEEHYKCHLLLCRFTYSIYRHKMLYASKMMINMKRSYQNRFIPNSRIYAWLKEKSAKSSSDLTKGKTYEELYGVEKAKEMRRKKSLPRGPQKPETVQKRAEKLKGLKPGIKIASSKIIAAIAGWYAQNPEMEISFTQDETALQSILGNSEAPIVVEVKGDDIIVLDSLVHRTKKVVQDIPGLYNFTTNMDQGYPEMNVMVDRFRAGTYGLAVSDIVTQITGKLTGQLVGQFDKNGELRDITIHLPKLAMAEMGDMIIRSGTTVVRLSEVASLKQAMAPKEIYHDNQIRVGKVMADMKKGASLDKISEEIQTKISAVELPNDYRFKIAGEEQKRQESSTNLKFALLLSIILVYMVLAAKFESLIHPFVILLSIPFAIVGTIILFYLVGQTFNMMALIGIIMLGGIAVNDSIILVDRINQLRELGMEKRQAIAQAGQQRLRPIVMMSIITVVALGPLTLGFGDSVALRAPMALAVIGGMVTSTLLTLIVIPCVYDLLTSNKPITGDN